MAILEIRTYPDEILKRPSAPVAEVTDEIKRLILDMAETMYANDGVGLAAPQVGVSSRIIVIDVGGPEILTLREIATLALETQGKPIKITSIPLWLTRIVVAVTRFFNRHQGELLAFFATATTTDGVAPRTGTHTLKAFYENREGGCR